MIKVNLLKGLDMKLDEDQIEDMARVCHEVNRAYCEQIGDNSQPSWNDAPGWVKQSAINGVKFHLDNPKSKASDSHDNWKKEKVATGWTYGPTKDPVTKTHPCIVPYDQLPQEQKVKDYLFLSVVRAGERLIGED